MKKKFLIFLNFCLLLVYISSNEEIIKKYPFSEIYLVVEGKGTPQLFNDAFNYEPAEFVVNGIFKPSCKKTCYFNNEKNNVIIKFDIQIESCKSMFEGLSYITELDLSKFDSSKVIYMNYMFLAVPN